MADQIIIELIGDPSGLKPAEEALKELSKAAEENLEAFVKANEAVARFTSSASSAAKAAKDMTDRAMESAKAFDTIYETANKSITAISNLNAVIAAGVVKNATAEYKDWAKEIGTLSSANGKLEESIKTAEEKIKANIASGKKHEVQNRNLTESVKGFQTQIDANNVTIATYAANLTESGKAGEEAGSKIGKGAKEASKFGEVALKNANDTADFIGHTKDLTSAMGVVGAAIASASGNEEKANEIKKKTAAALEAITLAQKVAAIATEGLTLATMLNEKAKAASNTTIARTLQLYVAEKLGLIELAVAQEGANTAEVAGDTARKSRFTLLAIDNGLQSTSALVRAGATAAQWALNAAMYAFPVLAIVAGVAALVLGFVGLVKWVDSVTGAFHFLSEAASAVGNFIRDVASSLTGGLIDNAELHKNKEQLKEMAKTLQEQSEELKKHVELMEAQGASAEALAKARQEQLQKEQEAIKAQLAVETDIEKKKELQNKLAETSAALSRSKEEIGKAHIETMKQEGASEHEILLSKQKQVVEAEKDLKTEIEKIKYKLNNLMISEEERKKLEEQLEIMEHQNKVLEAQGKEIDNGLKEELKKKAEAAAQWKADSLANAKTVADARLTVVQKGSEDELKLKIADLNAAAAVELNNVKGTEEQKKELREIINKKLAADIEAANSAFAVKNLEEEKKNLQVMIVLNEGNKKEQLRLSLELAVKEKEIALTNKNLTVNEKLLIEKQYTDKLKALRKQEIDDVYEQDKKELDANIEAEKEELETKKQYSKEWAQIQKNIAADEMQKKIDEVNHSVMSEIDKQKKIEAIKKQYAKEVTKIDDDIAKHEKQLEDQITAKKKAEDKKREDDEKKVGEAAIKLGKEVADAIFNAEAEKRKAALDNTIDTLEKQKEKELSNSKLTAAQKKAIEEKFRKEEAAAKLKAWKAEQKAKEGQAIINGALAVLNIIATMPDVDFGVSQGIAIGMAVATTAIQVAQIATQQPPKFAKGVIALNGPGTETSDSIAAYLSKGESVITAERTKQYKPILEQIQAGIYQPLPIPLLSTFPRLNDIGSLAGSSFDRGPLIDYDKLGRAVAQALPKNKTQQLSFDKKGFSHYLLSESGKIESYNNRYKE